MKKNSYSLNQCTNLNYIQDYCLTETAKGNEHKCNFAIRLVLVVFILSIYFLEASATVME